MSGAAAIHIGTCSWTDKTLLKSGFYPSATLTPASRLAYYSGYFDVVEVDSTFYALPDPGRVFKWIAGTPEGFMFGIKSFAIFTFHRAKFSSLPRWLREELGFRAPDETLRRETLTHDQRMRLFGDFIRPVLTLHDMGRLAYLLFQFPPNWSYSREALGYIRSVREVCGPLPLAIEVRNSSWLRQENRDNFLKVLRRENIAYVAVDEPLIGWTLPPDLPMTSEWGTVVRFHGRNKAAWLNSKASVHERFDYQYAKDELYEWKEKIETASINADHVYLMFNNCVSDKAVRSAELMREVLQIKPVNGIIGRQTTLGLRTEE